MTEVEKSIVVDVPVNTAYNQWTQFESFPKFMEGVEEVQQLDDKRLHWRAKVAGKAKEWDAEITQQVPDQVVAWKNTDGAENAGTVEFQPQGQNQTLINLHMVYDPEGVLESVGSAIGLASHRIEGDLERFKKFIEERGQETGAYRETINTPTGATQTEQPMKSGYTERSDMGEPTGGSFPEPGQERL
jgi:uncharacterized membrane protein